MTFGNTQLDFVRAHSTKKDRELAPQSQTDAIHPLSIALIGESLITFYSFFIDQINIPPFGQC